MRLNNGIHLAYCTNIHRGRDWVETFNSLKENVLRVRDKVSQNKPYAIGLRLGDLASRQLCQPDKLEDFKLWLRANNCYVFTINGFPYGEFHGIRVKEDVYSPDWTTDERVEYTKRLFLILSEIAPSDSGGSVSTVPCSYKEFITSNDQVIKMRENLWKVIDYINDLSERSGKDLHLGLEPEPLCYLETSDEMIKFYHEMRSHRPDDTTLSRRLGVNYDTCHLAVEYEEAVEAIEALVSEGIRISKFHFSSAMKVSPTPQVIQCLAPYSDDIYFHQVIARTINGGFRSYRDLSDAIDQSNNGQVKDEAEWRIHYHLPLHCLPTELFDTTIDQLLKVIEYLGQKPAVCSHIEIETYTWEVLPKNMRQRDVIDQIVDEYNWTLKKLADQGITPKV